MPKALSGILRREEPENPEEPGSSPDFDTTYKAINQYAYTSHTFISNGPHSDL